jgi:hypothetical protein
MVIQTTNIIAGFLLAAPKLKQFGGGEHVEVIHGKLLAFSGTIGVIELVLGVLALIERMGLAYFPIPMFGSSYPQALPAIAIGLILSAHLFEKYPAMRDFITKLKVYEVALGIMGIAVGLGSLLFGCVLCV